MQRAPVFLLVGPFLLIIVAACSFSVVEALLHHAINAALMIWVFFLVPPVVASALVLCLAVSAVAGLFDGYLAETVPLHPRALLVAISGAVVTVIPVGGLSRDILIPLAIGGAVSMGACSLLSRDF